MDKANFSSLQTPDTQDTVEDQVFSFLELSQKILTIIQHENAILRECGCLDLESYLTHKAALLQNYEESARALIEKSLQETANDATRHLLLSELCAVKSALSDNTHYQVESLQKKVSLTKGDKSWH